MADTEVLYPFNVSFNTPNRTIITIRGKDNEELIERLALANVPVGPDGTTMLEMIQEIDSAIAGQPGGSAPATAGAEKGQGSANPPCKSCGGPTEYKEGTGKNGHWEGYFCRNSPKNPTPANPKHEVNWL